MDGPCKRQRLRSVAAAAVACPFTGQGICDGVNVYKSTSCYPCPSNCLYTHPSPCVLAALPCSIVARVRCLTASVVPPATRTAPASVANESASLTLRQGASPAWAKTRLFAVAPVGRFALGRLAPDPTGAAQSATQMHSDLNCRAGEHLGSAFG